MITQEIMTIANRIQSALDPLRIYLFGSYAKDTFTENSDFDFYVVVEERAGDRIELAQKAYASLRGVRMKPVDIVVGYETSFEKRANVLGTIECEVKRDGILLYEKQCK